MSWRLDGIAADLLDQLTSMPAPRQRRVAGAVVGAALRQVAVDDERINDASAAPRERRYGDSSARAGVTALTNELDEDAWEIQDRVDAGHADPQEYLPGFGRSGAVGSLSFALDEDPVVAAVEAAAYEARAAVDDGAIRREIASVS